MASCSYCSSTILFGGKRVGEFRFCSDRCVANGQLLVQAAQLPPELVQPFVRTLHAGPCPICQGPGPVDVHMAHTVWSALVVTHWKNEPQVSCRSCGTKRQVRAALFSLVLGWWGFPWGFLMTPVQLVRNAGQLLSRRESVGPSPALERLARIHLAAQLAATPPS